MLTPDANWKRSIWAKLIAVCFICLIVLGNIWLVQRFSLAQPPLWLQSCFVICTGASFVFGAALLAERLYLKVIQVDQVQALTIDREREGYDRDGRDDNAQV